MHYKKVKGILSAHNGLNLYRGCTHGCIYCDSRSTCYQINHVFEDIEVKENAIELLEIALAKKRNKVIISTGAMTDPYLHIEEELGLTRQMLETVYKYGHGVHIQTKSSRILRDLDLLKKINSQTRASIALTLTTYDEELCKVLEPHVSTTKERFEALKIFKENKIDTYVWISPILPFINDTMDNLKGLLNYCLEAGVRGIICFGFGLTLREGNREYFYQCLDKSFPGIKQQYIKTYGTQYENNSLHNAELITYTKEFCEEHGIIFGVNEVFNDIKRMNLKDPYKIQSLF